MLAPAGGIKFCYHSSFFDGILSLSINSLSLLFKSLKMKNERLEILSDMVRRGEPIPMKEALEVIEYQTELKKQRVNRSWWESILFATPIEQFINLFKTK